MPYITVIRPLFLCPIKYKPSRKRLKLNRRKPGEGKKMDENEVIEPTEEDLKIREDIRAEVYEGKEPEEPAAEPEEIEPVEPVEVEKDPEPEEDPWAGVPPALRAQMENITGKLSSLDAYENRFKQMERRVGSVQNAVQNQAKQAKEAAKKVKNAPTQEEMDAAAKSKKEWSELKEEFPQWANALNYKLAEETAELKKSIPDVEDLRKKVSQVEGNVITPKTLETRLLGMRHPDWNTVRYTPEYKSWLQKQPQDIQQLHYKGKTAEQASYVLDRFKESRSKKQTKSKRLENAVTPESAKKTKIIKSEADLSDAALRKKYAQEIWDD